MSKTVVNEDQYIEALNMELKKHPQYEEGMEIIGVPEGYSGSDLSGYTYKGAASIMPGILAEITTHINVNYTLVVTSKLKI